MIFQFLINGIITGSIYALAALGFALVYNTTRIFHIAYGVLYMFAPYMMLTFFIKLQLPLIPAILIALLITVFLSILIELAVYRPLVKKKSSLNVAMISSIGVMIVIINLIALFYGNETKVLNNEISGSFSYHDIIITYSQLVQLIVSVVLMALFMLYLKFSKLGTLARGMRDDTELCRTFAVNTAYIRVFIFAVSGLFVACSGILIGWDVGMDPYVGMPLLLNAVVALIIGGIGRFYAPIIGGFLIGILQALTIWLFSANWQDAVTFGLLLLFLFFRPQGLFGEKRRLV